MKPGRQAKRQHNFHQFRWLQLHRPDINPALRALADIAMKQHEHQQAERHRIAHPGEAQDDPDINEGDAQHDHQTESEAQRVLLCIGIRIATARGPQCDIANGGNAPQQQHKKPRHAPKLGNQSSAATFRKQPSFEDHRPSSATRGSRGVGVMGRRWKASTRISRASGAAAPEPLVPCSTITESAKTGLS